MSVIVINGKLNRDNHAVVFNGFQGNGKPFSLQPCHSNNDSVSWKYPFTNTHGFQQSQPYSLSVRDSLIAVNAG